MYQVKVKLPRWPGQKTPAPDLFWRKIASKAAECLVKTKQGGIGKIAVEGEQENVERFVRWYEWMIQEPE